MERVHRVDHRISHHFAAEQIDDGDLKCPAASPMAGSVFVVDTAAIKPDYACFIHADTVKQKGMVFFRKGKDGL